MRYVSCLYVLTALFVGVLTTTSAQAANLPNPVIVQVINIGSQTFSDKAGALSKSTSFTSGATSVSLGGAPTITASMNESSGGNGGSVRSRLLYNVEYVNPGVFSNLNVYVNAFDQLSVSGSGYGYSAFANTFFNIAGNGQSFSFDHCKSTSSSGDICGNHGRDPIVPFSFSMRQNTIYTVDMSVNVQAGANVDVRGASNASAYGLLDPTFTVIGVAPQGGFFRFSPGITALPVPEPDTYALLLAGVAIITRFARRRAI